MIISFQEDDFEMCPICKYILSIFFLLHVDVGKQVYIITNVTGLQLKLIISNLCVVMVLFYNDESVLVAVLHCRALEVRIQRLAVEI